MMNANEMRSLMERLQEPFPAESIGWLPKNVSGNRCLAIAYIDARDVMNRLDEVVGCFNWQDTYDILPDNTCLCHLSIRFGDEWITKQDVGGESDQKESDNRRKSSVSDALKRTAVKWGIGRYLYSIETAWADYDPQKKCITHPPVLPLKFLPSRRPGDPLTAHELVQWLAEKEASLLEKGVGVKGGLQAAVVARVAADLNIKVPITEWTHWTVGKAAAFAYDHGKKLIEDHKKGTPAPAPAEAPKAEPAKASSHASTVASMMAALTALGVGWDEMLERYGGFPEDPLDMTTAQLKQASEKIAEMKATQAKAPRQTSGTR